MKMNIPGKNIGTALFLIIQIIVIVLCGLSTRPDVNWDTRGRHEKQYEELTTAFLNGQLSLLEPPAEFLSNMENPYDPYARTIAAAENDSYSFIDTSYYKGRYYVYFGPLPAVTAFIPLRILTGRIPPSWVVTIIYGVIYVLISWLFLEVLCERYGMGRISDRLRFLLTAVWIAATGTPFLTSFCVTYSIPVIASLCYTMTGLSAWITASGMFGFDERWRRSRTALLILGSICIAATFAIREEFILATLLSFPIFAREIAGGHFFRKDRAALRNTAAVIVPYLIICPVVMLYNALRFDNPLETGYSYLLSVSDLRHITLSFTHFKAGVAQLLLAPLNLNATFPFLHEVDIPDSVRETVYIEPMLGGFLAFNLIALFACGIFVPAVRRRMKESAGSSALVMTTLALAAVILLVDADIAGISMRYQYDFGYLLLIAAFLVIFACLGILKGRARTYFIAAVVVLSLLCICLNYLAVFSDGRYFAMRDTNPAVYEKLRSVFSGQ